MTMMINKINNIKKSNYIIGYNIMENKTKLEQLKKKLEKEGEEKLKKLYNDNKNMNKLQVINEKIDDVLQVAQDGEKEFVEKTGRYMTYSEIRELYG
jgi:hypothetical protein